LHAAGLVKSNGEARRLIAQGAVRMDGARIGDVDLQVETSGNPLFQVGKRRVVRVRFTD
jgi:tyrosyl-tRNA synthetase